MATRSDAPEPQVDELRRRARRRLVGAVILALAAAVLLPLLLESEPKPLGDDVSIQIPPIDSGKFINPLSSAKAPDPKVKGGTAASRSAAEPAGSASGAAPPAAPPVPKQGALGSTTPASDTPPATPSANPQAPTAGTQAAPAQSQAAAKPVTDAPVDAPPPVAPAKVETASTGAAYVVQIAAFSDHYGASSLANKLKHGGFPGYTEAVTTEKGTTLHRVRVGPYASREAADAALVKLKAAGFNGMVAHVG